MSTQGTKQSTVLRSQLRGKTPLAGLTALDLVCTAGAQCPEVQSSPVALHALNDLQAAVTTAHKTLNNKEALAQALVTALKALDVDLGAVRVALATYQAAVNGIAGGSAAVIAKAGLAARDQRPSPAALERVTKVTGQEGKGPKEAIISWPVAAGASAYAIEVNETPESPAGPWTALISGRKRRRVVMASAPGAQILVRVASLGSGEEQSEWSDPILVTAR